MPSDVRAMVEASTGAPLDGVPVHRGPDVAATASELSARAYTTEGEVHLPDEHGPLNSGPARALLAHELTHVAQQRALGSALPPEGSVAGAQLEADAVQNERGAVEHGTQLSPIHDGPRAMVPSTRSWDQPAPEAQPVPSAVDLPLAPQRAPLPTAAADPATAAIAAGVAASSGDGSIHFAPPGQKATAAQAPAGVQRAVELEQVAPAVGGAGGDEGGDEEDEVGKEQELDALAKRLWPRLNERLRGDLLVAKERAGELVERF